MKVYRPVAAEFPISSPYGTRVDPITKKEGTAHHGYDFATPTGTPVVAAYGGRIFKAGWQDENDQNKGFGLRVWQTAKINGRSVALFYAHLSELAVKVGDEITAAPRKAVTGDSDDLVDEAQVVLGRDDRDVAHVRGEVRESRLHFSHQRQQLGAAPQQVGAGRQHEATGRQQFEAGTGQQLGAGAHVGCGQQTAT